MRRLLIKLGVPLGTSAVMAAVVFGIFTGVGAYTFKYGEGLSYFSTNPAACKNCHVMNDQYDSWSKGPHHHVAGCVDCHLPHEFLPKYMAKAVNGYNHSRAFTLMDFPDPIQITPRNARILQESCLRCHAEFVDTILGSNLHTDSTVTCVHCHRGVGHGPMK